MRICVMSVDKQRRISFTYLSAIVPAGRYKLSYRINNELLYLYSAFVSSGTFSKFRHKHKCLTVSGHCKDRPVRTNKLLTMENNDNKSISTSGQGATPFAQTYFHGTKADLKVGDLIEVGFNSNYGQQKNVKYIFLTGTLDAAIWGAELAFGDGRERIYLVEPTGEIENDPDLNDKKFPGNPTQSYRSTKPFRVIGEVTVWQGHPAEQVKTMKEHLKKLKEQGINSLNDE